MIVIYGKCLFINVILKPFYKDYKINDVDISINHKF